MDKEILKTLQEINATLTKINFRQETDEMMAETNKIFERSDRRVEVSIERIQDTFDRIHDKVFNFNNILIGAFLVLGTFPANEPIVELWTIIFPTINMALMVFIDYKQMEIHRYATGEQYWTSEERDEYGRKIKRQTRLSLLSLLISIIILAYLIFSVSDIRSTVIETPAGAAGVVII